MSKYYGHTDYNGNSSGKMKPKKHPWLIALKYTGIVLGSLVVLAAIALWIISYHLTPEHIARLIEEKASEYLDAKIEIGKLDYKLYSSYPWLEFEVDSLRVISKSLESLSPEERGRLPENADSLAAIAKLKGKVNVHSLLHRDINIKDIEIESPRVNIVIFNDSLANYNIAQNTPDFKVKMPQVDISDIKTVPPVYFSFFSLPADTEASVNVEEFFLVQDSEKIYDIGFEGVVNGRWGEYSIPQNLPVEFKTRLKPNLPDLAIDLKRLYIASSGIALDLNGEMKWQPSNINLQSAQIDLKIADLFALPQLLPAPLAEKVQLPQHLEGFLPLALKVNLLHPYELDLGEIARASTHEPGAASNQSTDTLQLTLNDLPLPSLRAVATVEEAFLEMKPPGLKMLKADDISMSAIATYDFENPENNSLELKKLLLKGEGLHIEGDALIILGPDEQPLSANLDFRSAVTETLAYFLPGLTTKVTGYLQGNVNFKGLAVNYGKQGIKDINVDGDVKSKALKVKVASSDISMKNVATDFKGIVPAYPLTDYSGLKLYFDFSTDSLRIADGNTRVNIGKMTVSLDAMDTVSGTPDPFGDLHLKITTLNTRSLNPEGGEAMEFRASDLDLVAQGSMVAEGNSSSASYPSYAPTPGSNDQLIASRVEHTPMTLEYDGGGVVSTIMGMVNADAELKLGNAYFYTPAYLYPFEASNLDISTNLNRVNFFAGDVKISNTGFTISGEIDGLEPFLTSYEATPLKTTADIKFTNVDINRLSWGYYGAQLAQGNDSVWALAPLTPYTKADSVSVLIPRNIDAQIRLHSSSAEYMQYRFSPLSTCIVVKDGAATLQQLTIGAPYCTAVVDWTYSTSSLDNIFMDLKAKVSDFSFIPFYKVFPSLVAKAPELQNFTGNINADINCRFLMYPDMFMNSQSLQGSFDITGNHLQFAREGKIAKITHLMLIEGDEPIHLQNLNITGAYHDNLLQINPFLVAFDDYELKVGGVNNMAGRMYYHLALLKSPFHLPFGVSLFGNLKHPEIRLGGTHIDDYRSEMVADDETNRINANIMAYLHHGWILFLQEAARYQQKKETQPSAQQKITSTSE